MIRYQTDGPPRAFDRFYVSPRGSRPGVDLTDAFGYNGSHGRPASGRGRACAPDAHSALPAKSVCKQLMTNSCSK